ncbi:MAG: FAD-binding oxidoreductase [Pseudomonadota bacterium]
MADGQTPVDAALDALAQDLHPNQIALPGSADYAETVAIDNGRIAYHPAAVIYPETAADVQRVLAVCRQYGVHFTLRNGGHNAVGWCLNDGGIVVHLKRLRQLALDAEARTLMVGSGLLWGDVYGALRDSGLVPIGGGSTAVGVSGFTLGGGFSFLSRSHGLAVDNLLAVEFVTADGELLTLGPDETDPDRAALFWALRGGGGGNLGVATAFTSNVFPAVPDALGGVLVWDIADAARVLHAYRSWVLDMPDTLDAAIVLSPTQLILLAYCHSPHTEGLAVMQPMIALAPKINRLAPTGFYDFIDTYGSSTTSAGKSTYIAFGNVAEPPDDAFFDTLVEHIATAPSTATQIALEYAGGAIARVPPTATAFPWRHVCARCEIKATWDSQKDDATNIAWAERLKAALGDALSGGDVNQQDPLLTDWPAAYYGDNYPRLQRVKARWDPDNVFRFPQSIRLPDAD